MTGREKCRILRAIREKIARANDIHMEMRECTHQGDCTGTCPYCEGEVKKLEDGLRKREGLGKKIALIGLCAGLAATSAGCTLVDDDPETVGIMPLPTQDVLSGDIAQGPEDIIEMGEVTMEDAP